MTRWRLVPPCRGPSGSGRWQATLFPPARSRAVEARPAPVDLARRMQAFKQDLMQAPPHAGRLPVAQPTPAAHAAAAPPPPPSSSRRQHLPGMPERSHEQDAGQSGTVVHPGTPALGARWCGGRSGGDRSPESGRAIPPPTLHRPDHTVLLGALNPVCPEVGSMHERIDLPLARPMVEQHRRLGEICPACRRAGRCDHDK